MKKYFLLFLILSACILSYAQFDFLRESVVYSSAPSYLIVKVKSPSYEGEAVINSIDFYSYYSSIVKKKVEFLFKKYYRLAYRDIKRGRCFIVSDEDFSRKYYNINQKYYVFEKIILNDSVLDIAKKGIEFFIRTYFDEKGIFIPSPPYDTNDFYTIVKVMFDARIQTGIGSEWSNYRILDRRFFNDDGFVIPPEYRDSKKNVKNKDENKKR